MSQTCTSENGLTNAVTNEQEKNQNVQEQCSKTTSVDNGMRLTCQE